MKHNVKKVCKCPALAPNFAGFLKDIFTNFNVYLLTGINGPLNHMCITISYNRIQFYRTFLFVANVSERTKLETIHSSCLYCGFTC